MNTARQELEQIARNVDVHNKVARKYDRGHTEIFNPIEQERLAATLARALASLRTGANPPRALDYGCGSGNLTRHLLALGCEVVAADVSPHFLDLVRGRFPEGRTSTLLMNGKDLVDIGTAGFDVVATYSVLHHVPDYLTAVSEMARVCRPGGVLYIDHEPPEAWWDAGGGGEEYKRFKAEVEPVDWRKFLKPSNYVHKIRRLFNPRHTNEGDIHVWADDHIEWAKVESLLEAVGFEPVMREDYLLFRGRYRREVYERYRARLHDMRAMAFRKLG